MRDFFAYGTLQPGERLYSAVERDVIKIANASIEDFALHYAPGTDKFPVLVPSQGSVTQGTLLRLNASPDAGLWAVLGMEHATGYHVALATVLLAPGQGDRWRGVTETQAIVCIWPHPWIGEPVPDNDWITRG